MDIIRDTFVGLSGELITDHIPELGGPLVKNASRTTVDAIVTGSNTAKGSYAGSSWYNYTTRLPIAAYSIKWTTRVPASDQTSAVGIILSNDVAFSTYLRVEIRPSHSDIRIDNNGTITSFAFSSAPNQVDLWELQIVDHTGANRLATLRQNGSTVGTVSNTAITDSPLLTILWDGTATPGDISELYDLSATTLANVPLIATAFLSTELAVFAQYTPATASELAALRFEYAARAIILKGSLADAAVVRLMYTTPPEFIFAP